EERGSRAVSTEAAVVSGNLPARPSRPHLPSRRSRNPPRRARPHTQSQNGVGSSAASCRRTGYVLVGGLSPIWGSGNLAIFDRAIGDRQWIAESAMAISA